MRFSCGLSYRERLDRDWPRLSLELKEKLTSWERHFAWFPTRVQDSKECVWLEWVWKNCRGAFVCTSIFDGSPFASAMATTPCTDSRNQKY